MSVWTPVETVERRQARSRRRKNVKAPMLPTFVFADYLDLPALVLASQNFSDRFPPFSVFKHGDAFPRVPDASLAGLREHEEHARIRAAKKAPKKRYFAGQTIRTSNPAFEGLNGKVVETSKGSGSLVLVVFPGLSIPVKIAPWLLKEVQLNDEVSEQDAATGSANGKQRGAG